MSGSAELPTGLALPDDARFAIVATRFNADIVERLLDGARRALRAAGVADAAVIEHRVPGAWELPLAAAWLASRGDVSAVIALGCVIRGDTRHYEHVADQCAAGLMRLQLDQRIPVANGVLAVERREDAQARAGGSAGNKGEDAAQAALAMVALECVIR